METGVARLQIDLEEYREQLAFRQGKGQQVRHFIMNKARTASPKRRVVFAEGEETKIIRAAVQVQEEGIGHPILIGKPDIIEKKVSDLGLRCCPEIVDPIHFDGLEKYAKTYHELRERKGVTVAVAMKHILDPNVFGPMMVKMGDSDAFVSGLVHDYPEVIRPALQIHHTHSDARIAAAAYIMIVDNREYIFADATVNIEPSSDDLVDIACLAERFARQLGLEPRVAFLSFSNFGSTPHALSNKIRRAVDKIRQTNPDMIVDGEMQADTAVVPEIVEERYPFSQVKDANVLVFPSLEAANIAYKLLARLGGAQAIGPILLGMGAPVHVLQTGDEVRDIVNIAAVAIMDAMSREE
jgi:malate dehydrogenase (oxaloacetate-decarboxylating)(NADP+)